MRKPACLLTSTVGVLMMTGSIVPMYSKSMSAQSSANEQYLFTNANTYLSTEAPPVAAPAAAPLTGDSYQTGNNDPAGQACFDVLELRIISAEIIQKPCNGDTNGWVELSFQGAGRFFDIATSDSDTEEPSDYTQIDVFIENEGTYTPNNQYTDTCKTAANGHKFIWIKDDNGGKEVFEFGNLVEYAAIKTTITPLDDSGKSSQTVCSGSPVTIGLDTESITGGSISYSWTRGNATNETDDNDDGNSESGTSAPIECTLTNNTENSETVTFTIKTTFTGDDGAVCAVDNTATVVVYAEFDAGTIESDTYSSCNNANDGQEIVESDLDKHRGGDEEYSYRWLESYNGAEATVIDDATDETYTPPAKTAAGTYTYQREVKDKTCESDYVSSDGTVTRVVYAEFDAGAITSDPDLYASCNGAADKEITESDSPTGGDGVYSYRWAVSTDDGVTFTDISGANVNTYTPDKNLEAGTYIYQRKVKDGTCDEYTPSENTVERVVYSAFVKGEMSVTEGTICEGIDADDIIIDTEARGGSGEYTYYWYDEDDILLNSGTDATSYDPGVKTVGTYNYVAKVKDNNGCSDDKEVIGMYTLTVSANPTHPTPVSNEVKECIPANTTTNITLEVETAENENEIYRWWSDNQTIDIDDDSYLGEGTSITIENMSAGDFTAYVEKYNTETGCVSSRVPVTAVVNTNPTKPEAANERFAHCGAGTVALSVTDPEEENVEINWYDQNYDSEAENTPLSNGSATSYTTPDITTATTYYVVARNTETNCISEPEEIVAYIDTIPTTPEATDKTICGTGDVTLTATGAIANEGYRWYETEDATTTIGSGDTYIAEAVPAGTTVTVYVEKYNTETGCPSVERKEVKAIALDAADLNKPEAVGDALCGPGIVELRVTSTLLDPDNEIYVWYDNKNDSVATGLTYKPSLTTSMTYHVVTRNTLYGCESEPYTVVAIINVIPEVPTIADVARCETEPKSTIGITRDEVAEDVKFYWYDSADGGLHIHMGDEYTPDIDETQTYYVEAVSEAGCSSTIPSTPREKVTAYVHDNPSEPVLTPQPVNVCEGGQIEFVAAEGSGTYNWGGSTAGGAESSSSYIYENVTAGVYMAVVKSEQTYSLGGVEKTCYSETVEQSATVYSNPAKPEIESPLPVCAGEDLVFTATPATGAICDWSLSTGGAVSEDGNSYTFANATAGKKEVVVRSAHTYNSYDNGTGGTFACYSDPATTVSSSVVAIPAVATIDGDSQACDLVEISATAENATTYEWYRVVDGADILVSDDDNDNDNVYTVKETGDYRVIAINEQSGISCSADMSAVKHIEIVKTPKNVTLTVEPGCDSDTLKVTVDDVAEGVVYKWYKDGAELSVLNPASTYLTVSASGIYSVTATNGACPSDASNPVTVTIVTTPAMPELSTEDTSVCNKPIEISATDVGADSYDWYKDGVLLLEHDLTLTTTETGTGTYTVKAVNDGRCESKESTGLFVRNTTIQPEEVRIVNAGKDTTGCGVGSVVIEIADADKKVNTTGYQWYIDKGEGPELIEGATGASYSVDYIGRATYTVQAMNYACERLSTDWIEVNIASSPFTTAPAPVINNGAAFVHSCDSDVELVASPVSNATEYRWYKDKGAVEVFKSSSISYTVSGLTDGASYTVRAADDNGCMGTLSDTIRVYIMKTPEQPVFTSGTATEILCQENQSFTLTFDPVEGATEYRWYNGSDLVTTTKVPSYEVTQSGTYSVIPVNVTDAIQKECVGAPSEAKEIVIMPKVTVKATPETQTVSSGRAIKDIILSPDFVVAEKGTVSYAWTMTLSNPSAVTTEIESSGTASTISGAFTFVDEEEDANTYTATFIITPSYVWNSVTCTGDPITVKVTINPKSTDVAEPQNQIICNKAIITAINLISDEEDLLDHYTWEFTLPVGVTSDIAETGTINKGDRLTVGSFTNATNAPQDVIFSFVPYYKEDKSVIAGDDFSATVTVLPEITGRPQKDGVDAICSGEEFTIDFTTDVTGGSMEYKWTSDITADLTENLDNSQNNITGTIINTTGAAKVVTFTVTPVYTYGDTAICPGATFTKSIIVNSGSAIEAEVDTNVICSGNTVMLSINDHTPGATMEWNFVANQDIVANTNTGSDFPVSIQFVNKGTSPTTATIIVTPKLGEECSGTPDTVEVVVNPPIVIDVITTDATCAGAKDGSVVVTATGGGHTYILKQGNTAITSQPTGNFVNVSAGTYMVEVVNSTCTATMPAIVTGPSATLSGSIVAQQNAACGTGGSVTATVVLGTGTEPYTYTLSNGQSNATGIFTNLQPNSYTISIVDASNCTSPVVLPFDIGGSTATPTVTSVTAKDVTCNDGADGELHITVSADIPYSAYRILRNGTVYGTYNVADLGNANIITGLPVGNYKVIVIDETNDCQSPESAEVTISEPVQLTYDYSDIIAQSTCNMSDGSAVITVNGGNTGPYQFVLTNGLVVPNTPVAAGTTYKLTGLGAGESLVFIVDSKGCRVPTTVKIPSANNTMKSGVEAGSLRPVLCYGDNSGGFKIEATGGTKPYTYNYYTYTTDGVTWSAPIAHTTAVFSGLSAGTYKVVLSDAAACTSTVEVLVEQPDSPLVINTQQTAITCFGATDGKASVNVTGGTAPYTYNWTNGATTSSISGLKPGMYSVTVTDANGCSEVGQVEINGPATALSVSNVAENVVANCDNVATVGLHVNGGIVPFTFSLAGQQIKTSDYVVSGDGVAEIYNVPAGTFELVVTDANGCSATANITVASKTNNITATVVNTPDAVTCKGDNSSIVLTVAEGNPFKDGQYEFQWNNNAPVMIAPISGSYTISELGAGDYRITVRDAENCSFNIPVTVNIPAAAENAIRVNVTVLQVLNCKPGEPDGKMQVAIAGGKMPYSITYESVDGITKKTIDNITANTYVEENLPAGYYTVMVTDATGCNMKAANAAVITQPDPITFTTIVTTPHCAGDANGSILITNPQGGNPANGYAYSKDGVTYGSVANFTNLATGTYRIYVRDNSTYACEGYADVVVTETDQLTITADVTPPTVGLNNGLITLIATGGTRPYKYSKDNTNYQKSEIFNNISAGEYHVSVKDNNGCTATMPAAIVVAPTLSGSFTIVPNVIAAGCFDGATGAVSLTVTGGAGNFEYSMNAADENSWKTESIFTGLQAGDYTIYVRDAARTVNSVNVTVGNAEPIIIEATYKTDGTSRIEVSAKGGKMPLQYSLNGQNWSENTVFTNPPVGENTIYVKDGNACENTTTTVVVPTGVSPQTIAYSVSRSGSEECGTEAINITNVTGGNGNYIYKYKKDNANWIVSDETTATDYTITATAGTYVLQVADNAGQESATLTVVVTMPANGINLKVTTNATCYNSAIGSITLEAIGGSGILQYSIDGANFQNLGTFSGLAARDYTVWARDAAGCRVSQQATVSASRQVILNVVDMVNASTDLSADGSVTVSATGGNGDFTYAKSLTEGYQASALFSNLQKGTYTFYAKDGNGCIGIAPANLAAAADFPDVLSVTANVTKEITCSNAADGEVIVKVFGATNSVEYSTNNATWQEKPIFTGLVAGIHTFYVKDAVGARGQVQITLNAPAPLIVVPVLTKPVNVGNGAEVTVTATGGFGELTYAKGTDEFDKTNVFGQLATGSYTFYAKDVNGCMGEGYIDIGTPNTPPNVLTVTATVVAELTCVHPAEVLLTVTGGVVNNYKFSADNGVTWQDGGSNYTFEITTPGTYYFQADQGGLMSNVIELVFGQPTTDDFTLKVVDALSTITNCYGESNAFVTLATTGGNGINRWYRIAGEEWTTASVFSGLTAGVYKFEAKDEKGCVIETEDAISIKTPSSKLNVSAEVSGVAPNASVTVSATGGVTPYQYSKNAITFDTDNVLPGYDTGTYYVYARDNNGAGCIDSAKVQIGDATSLHIAIKHISHVTIFGLNNGSAELNVFGGSGNYEILVNGGWISLAKIEKLYAGEYTFYVRDDKGRTGNIGVTITQPEKLVITSVTIASFAADGTATVDVLVAGGVLPHTYSSDGTIYGKSSSLSGYPSGWQTVFAKDKNGSVATAMVFIPVFPDDIMVSAFVSKNITCEGVADAEVTVTASNGTEPYQYSKTGEDNTWSSNTVLSGFAPGMQKVYVRDAKGKTAYTLVDIQAPVALRIAAYAQAPSSATAIDGIVTVNVIQGTAPFTFSKFSNSGWQSSAVLNGFGTGPYTVYAKDANNCPAVSASGHITHDAPDGLNAAASVWQHVTCYAGNDGIINITATGGTATGSYAYTIKGKDSTSVSTNFADVNSHTIKGLTPGTYIIFVTKGNESISTPLTVVINGPSQLTLTAATTAATCYGKENGIIIATATGGSGLFKEYSINGVEWGTSNTFTNVASGMRTVYVRDAYGCMASTNATIQTSEPFAFTVRVVQYDNTNTENDGIVEVDKVEGGVAPYMFSNGSTWTSERRFEGMTHGDHVIYAKDANGCIASYNIYVPNNADSKDFGVTAFVSKQLTCANSADAEITFVSSANDIGYSRDGQTYEETNKLIGFAVGKHMLYARSLNSSVGKVIEIEAEVLPVAPVTIEAIAVIPSITETTSLASVNITAKGGIAPLHYRLNTTTNALSNVITDVAAGTYTVTVTDANNCTATAPLLVNDKPATETGSDVSITAEVTQVLKCSGVNDAQITVTASGASGAYMYSLDNGATWAIGSGVHVFTGLSAGTYKIIVRDAANAVKQSDVLTMIIVQPEGWSITATATTEVICTGDATGQITVTSTAVDLMYSKNRQDWTASNLLTGFAAGTYQVFAKDVHGCIREAVAIVTQNTYPLTITNAEITKAITLAGGAEITVTVTGGTPAYTYAIDENLVTNNKIQNVAAGTHEITVTDANGCSALVTVPVTASGDGIATLNAQITASPKCYGDNTGEITVTIKGGQAPYTYFNGISEFTSSVLTYVFTSLSGGVYPITVTDANGYSLTQEVLVNTPEQLTVSAWGSDAGIIVAEAKGGTPVYSYYLNNMPPISSNVFNGLALGTYVVNVTDANGCKAQTQTPIEVIDKNKPNENNFSIKAEITNDISCSGADGEITVTVMNGTGMFMYAKGNGVYQPSNIFTGLTAGEYVFSAKNTATEITKQITITMLDNAPLTLNVLKIVPVSAVDATDGKVILQATGGKSPYQYMCVGKTEWQNSFVFEGLTATTYSMAVKDANGCEMTITISLSDKEGLMPSIKTQGNVTCYGGSNGWVEVYVTGGSGDYSYSLDNYTWQTLRILTGLCAGTHTLYVKDNNTLNTTKITAVITQPVMPLKLTAVAIVPVDPAGSNTTAVKLTAQGGTPNYHYADVAKIWDIKDVLTGFSAGYHTLFVRDANKCMDSAMVNIGDGSTAISLSAVVTKPLSCFGGVDAEITLMAGNGTGSYLYSKDGNHWGAANVLTDFAAGSYTLYAKDAATSATITAYVEVVAPKQLAATAVVTKPVSEEGQVDGEVKFIPTGGVPPYQYRTELGSWQNEDIITGLPVGTHTFYVKDANNCAEVIVRVLMGVDAGVSSGVNISLTAAVSGKVTCNTTGTITAIARDGDGTFEFSLNGGTWVSTTSNTYVFTGLAVGTYSVAVRSGGQTATVNQLIVEGVAPIKATVVTTDILCYGQADGKATITATGGIAPYLYARTGYAMNSTNEITGLGAGTHVLFVRDALGCSTTVTAVIRSTEKLAVTAVVAREITYEGGNNAVVEATATGGTPGAVGYHYSRTGASWIYNSNLVPNYGSGQAKVYVRDENNCIAEAAVFIGDYSSSASNTISLTAMVSRPISCYGKSDAEIMLNVIGGTPEYTYSKDGVNYVTESVLTDFPAGEHKVYVKDAQGKVANVIVTVPSVLPLTAYAIVGNNGQDKIATVIAEGGSNNYNYAIMPNVSRTGNVFAPIAAGTYTIIVSDANGGCEAAPIYLNVSTGSSDVSLSASVTNPLACVTGNDAEITAVASGGVAPYQFSRNNGTFQTGSNVFVYANLGAGTYAIVAKDAKGTISNTVNIPIASAASASLIIDAVVAQTNTCYGVNDGVITVTANGGVPALQYSINGVDYQLNNTFGMQQLQQGSRNVYVKDAMGCVQQSIVTIPATPEQLQLIIMSTTPPATGNSNGIIVAEAAGGIPVYTYTNGLTTQEDDGTFTALAADTYTVKVTDSQNCEDVSVVILGNGDGALSIRSIDTQNPKCYGDNSGMITVNVFGGTAPYYYSLADTNYVESVNVFTGLTAGTYTVYVKDAQATPAKTTVTVVLEAASQMTVSAAVVAQNGNKVDIQAVATGGQVPYSYEMGGYFNTTDGLFTNMLSGSYTVYARDVNNCEATTTIWAGDNNAGSPSITIDILKGVLCAGDKTAEVKVTVTGGVAPYQYSADNVIWQETNRITGLGAGKQTIYVKEANGKVTAASVVINAPEALNIAIVDIVAATAVDKADGAVTLLATGGQPSYLYSIDDENYLDNAQIGGLLSATYTAYAKDANGCKVNVPVTISSTDGGNGVVPIDMWAEVISNITCVGEADAVVAVHVRNNTNVVYSKDKVVWSLSNILTGFAAGERDVYVKDNSTGNIGTLTITVKAPVAIQAAAFVSARLSSVTAADGEFTIYAVGGTGHYTYAINGGAFQESPVFGGLAAGTYTFSVKDENGCQITIQAVMTVVDVIVSTTAVEVKEGGEPASYTVRLSHQPTAAVGLLNSVAVDTTVNAAPKSMEYTTANWHEQQLMKVTAVDNTITDGTRSNSIHHVVAKTADERYKNIERQVVVIARDNDYRDCQQLVQIVKQGFMLDGKAVTGDVTECLPEGVLRTLTVMQLNGVDFKWTITGVNGINSQESTTSPSIVVAKAGTYSVVVTDRFGCVATSDQVVMNLLQAPTAPVFLINQEPAMTRPASDRIQEYVVDAQDAKFAWTYPSDWSVAPDAAVNLNSIPLMVGRELGNICVTASDWLDICPVATSCLGVSSFQRVTPGVTLYPTSLPGGNENEVWVTPSGFDIESIMVVDKLGTQQTFSVMSTEGILPIKNGVQAKIVLQNLSAGHYFLIFKGTKGESVSKLVMKE